ncbi:Transcriptional regulator [Archaeoglobus sulfaticallidus PM70-1]|uniref:Transcriptional regulator n=1 Tax=Archaeoglobus sulfaticallidus PM70-1 TaxID=387631 RepID=N0BG66_9EURY|nr:MarR family winged helix-turn-helix transcriptional regulator [Archaeoglobus sulfaticallidus]AGK61292.1 Transcriptional regulator [Archaeoglobus sulfaticallidus PM70-1]
MDHLPPIKKWIEDIENLLKNTQKRKVFLYIFLIKGADFADIARYVRISQKNLTKHIKDFEFIRLIKSEVSPKDRRKKIYEVTPFGRDFISYDIRSIGMYLDLAKAYLNEMYSEEGEDVERRVNEVIGRYIVSHSNEPSMNRGPLSEAVGLFLYFLRYSRRINPQDLKSCLFFNSEESKTVLTEENKAVQRLLDAAICSKKGCSVCNLILDVLPSQPVYGPVVLKLKKMDPEELMELKERHKEEYRLSKYWDLNQK